MSTERQDTFDDRKEAMLRERVLIAEAARFERARIREWAVEAKTATLRRLDDTWANQQEVQANIQLLNELLDFLNEKE